MYRNGYYGVTLVFVAPIAAVLFAVGLVELGLLAGVGAVALAMVPDLDQRILLVTHREITHTIWFTLLVGMITAGAAVAIAAASVVVPALIGFVAGT